MPFDVDRRRIKVGGGTLLGFAILALASVSCATVESNLQEGNIYDACALAAEGTHQDRTDVSAYIEQKISYEIEELDWSDSAYLGEPLLHDELVLYRLRVQLPPDVRGTLYGSTSEQALARLLSDALPALNKPDAEMVPLGPLVIPPPPMNAVYKPPRLKRRKRGLIDAFVSLITLPATLVRVGVEVAVSVIRIPFDIANGIMRGGSVRVPSSSNKSYAPTPAHRSSIFNDVLLNEAEWRAIVDAAEARYKKSMNAYSESIARRNARIAALESLILKPCLFDAGGRCEVVRVRRRPRETSDNHWFSLRLEPLVEQRIKDGSDNGGGCRAKIIDLHLNRLVRPVPFRTIASAKTKATVVEESMVGPPPPTKRSAASLPAFLWRSTPPTGLARAFAEASTESGDGLRQQNIVCKVDIKHPLRWNEPKAPDPIVRLTWGKMESQGQTSVGPDNVKRFYFISHDVTLRPGDRIRMTMGDRDGPAVEYMGIGVRDFDGTMPIKFDLTSYKAECRAMSNAILDRRAGPSIAKARRHLARLEKKIARATVTTSGGGYPTRQRERVDAEITKVAGWLGPTSDGVNELLVQRAGAKLLFEGRVDEKRKTVRAKARAFESPFNIDENLRVEAFKSLCAPTHEERDRVDFFVPNALRKPFLDECIAVLVVSRKDGWGSISALDHLGLQMVNANGEKQRGTALVGDHNGWFSGKNIRKGESIVMLLSSPTNDDVVIIHSARGVAYKPTKSDETKLDPVALGATAKQVVGAEKMAP